MGFGYGGTSQAKSRDTMERRAPTKQRRYTFGTHANTCHVWAQQQAETRIGQSSDGRISFDGETIFSYGQHFPMAKFIGDYEGQRVVLFNADSYSSSTGGHKSDVRGALQSTDILIRVPTDFLKAETPDRESVNAVHESLLESVASHLRAASGERPSYYTPKEWADQIAERNKSVYDAMAAFRSIYKVRQHIPADIVKWSDDRAAVAQRAALRSKLDDARRVALQAAAHSASGLDSSIAAMVRNVTEASEESPADASVWSIERAIARLKGEASKFYSARQTLSKLGAARRHVKACSAVIRALTEARTPWEDALPVARRRESRDADIAAMTEVRAWLADKSAREPRAFWNYKITARLWSVAIAEGWQDVAEALARKVHDTMWRMHQVPEYHAPYRRNDGVTLEQWLSGKGESSWHGGDGRSGVHVRRKGDRLETTMGAECPFPHAVIAFRKAQECRATGESWQRNGQQIRVGTFHVDRIESDGTLRAGCHTIAYDAMLRLAVQEVPELVLATFPVPALIPGHV